MGCEAMRRAWNWLAGRASAVAARFSQLLASLRWALRQPMVRRRLAIVGATLLVLAYTVGVGSYVMLMPDIGIRCAFTPQVNHFNAEFLVPGAEPLDGDDTIVQLGDQEVTNWAQILHELVQLRRRSVEPGTAADMRPDSGKSHFSLNGEE